MDQLVQVAMEALAGVISGNVNDLIHHIEHHGGNALSNMGGDDHIAGVLHGLNYDGLDLSTFSAADLADLANALIATPHFQDLNP